MAVSGNMIDPQTDAVWILSATFIIFTMQSGFGLLESGSVSVKNELNIMVKNAVDVVFGGLCFWMFGYGLSFGDSEYSNPVVGWGYFFVNADDDKLGVVYSKFFFQASFATTATTIVSGAMAERTKLTSYMLFSMFNTILFCIPAHWVWASNGWLYNFGVVDIAGAGPVHVVGGLTGLVATLILKPRHGRYDNGSRSPPMSSPTNAVLGMFMLWWGWLGFNCGSTFGISGLKWKLAARSAASTLCSSVAGGVAGFLLSYIVKKGRFDVTYMINGLLGALVSVTAVCAIVQPWEGLVIGFLGSFISNGGVALLNRLKIDDPVGCVGTHALSGIWGILAAGLFIKDDDLLEALYLHGATAGLFYGGGFRQLGVQTLAVVAIAAWTIITAFIILKLLDLTIGLRVSLAEEIIGADIVEHGIGDMIYDKETGTVIYPPDDPLHNATSHSNQTLVKRRTNLSNRTRNGITHLLGHSGRRKTLSEINLDLFKEVDHPHGAGDITTHFEADNSERCSPRLNGIEHISHIETSPNTNTTNTVSVISSLRERFLAKSRKREFCSLDQNDNTELEDFSSTNALTNGIGTKATSLHTLKPTQQDLVEKLSNDSYCDNESSVYDFGTLSEGMASTNTITFELEDSLSTSNSEQFNNPDPREITRF